MSHALATLVSGMEIKGEEHEDLTREGEGVREALLLRRFMEGDNAAFVELFNRHNHRLYVYCIKFVGDGQTAEDLTQELWEKVLRLRSEPQKIRNPIGFFLRVARNLCLNYLKANRRLSPLDNIEEGAHPAESMHERSEMEEIVLLALQQLSFDYREVLILHAYSGYKLEEIARMLGKSVQAVWKRASRARVALRELVVDMMERNRIALNVSERTPDGYSGGENE